MKKRILVFIFYFILLPGCFALGQNVVIVVIDGMRYSESFGAKDRYIPKIWNELRPHGMIWNNFYNDGITSTIPGHSSIITGTWQKLINIGTERPTQPTVFEYLRKATGASERSTAVIAGKPKLNILAYSTSAEYGVNYKASFSVGEDDISVVNIFKKVIFRDHPRITLMNLPDVDNQGHSGNWEKYTAAIHNADSLVCEIWRILQANSVYRDNTTLFVTNDHGRHDKKHGGFKKHGDACEGCRHIMLLAIGRGFPINRTVTKTRTQIDIAQTIGKLLSIPTKYSEGTNLLDDTVSIAR